MRNGHRLALLVTGCALLILTGCRDLTSAEEVGYEPATVEKIEGSEVSRVILKEDAARRIELDTSPAVDAGRRVAVPASAIWVDVDGEAWVYTNPEPLVFVRAPVVVDRYEDGTAYLSRGLAPGTEVATVGVAELIGSEFGI